MLSEKITYLRKLRKITEKELSTGIGMSMTGFRQAMANDDFKVSTIHNIAKVLKVDVLYFFQESASYDRNISSLAEPLTINQKCEICRSKDEIIKQKEQTIEDLKFTIENLKSLIMQKDAIINRKDFE